MQLQIPNAARILIVDDDAGTVGLLERLLARAGCTRVRSTTDPRRALDLFLSFSPDLIILDLAMPHLDGFQVMEELRPHWAEGDYLPVLVLTGYVGVEARRRAMATGATDFVVKPFDHFEILIRIGNLLRTRAYYLELQKQNAILEKRVRERTQELEEAQIEILERLALVAEYHDDKTGEHTRRVAQYSACIARALGLPEAEVELIERAALLHDIGKIAIPDAIRRKAGTLSPAESEMMRKHTTLGAELLSGSRFALLRLAKEIAQTHHERWDGAGYPRGLKGEEIPLSGRIVAVADAFDALTHERSYKAAWSVEEAIAEIRQQSGRQFDPRVVEAFLEVVERLVPVGSEAG
ncbi:MAG TPA: HD domain-containing phosphohydrolase [Longimicrobiales bacterium]